jgi:hypothetical protein
MPFGKGKTLFGDAGGLLDKIVGGWEFHGTARIQSGAPIDLGNVNLVGMTVADLQKEFKLRFDDTGRQVFGLPDDIILNTRRAFGVSATTASGYGALGVPTGRYIAPANGRTCIQVVSGDCAAQNVNLYANQFTRFDLGAVKKTKLSERVNFEFRAEFLNAFNHINFTQSGMNTTFTSANFGRVTAAFRDTANSDDPGGRLVQFVLRLNF